MTRPLVMLLGQAESGKSTLQKQFQLYYASQTLEHERPSWRPVVYFNIIKAVRMILDELDVDAASPSSPSSLSSLSSSDPDFAATIRIGAPIYTGDLRTRLLPLIAIEGQLASGLSGGVCVTGGRSGVYVRTGWQALVDPAHSTAGVTELTAATLAGVWEEIVDLWQHPAVRRLLQLRKLRLEEAAPL